MPADGNSRETVKPLACTAAEDGADVGARAELVAAPRSWALPAALTAHTCSASIRCAHRGAVEPSHDYEVDRRALAGVDREESRSNDPHGDGP